MGRRYKGLVDAYERSADGGGAKVKLQERSDLTMTAKVPRKGGGLILSQLLVAIFAVLIIGSLLFAVWAVKASKSKQSPVSETPKSKQSPASEPSKQEPLLNVQLATSAANRDFPRFLKGAWPQKKDYGFKVEDEQNDVSLAEPIRVYSIDGEIVAKLNRAEDLAAAVKPIGELIYPVQVKQEYRTLFGIRLRDGEWRGTYLGNPYLAASLQGIRKAWASKNGDGFKLVSCIQPRSFFFIALNTDKPNLTPVTRVAIGSGQYLVPPADWKVITPAETVLEPLKSFWKASDTNNVPLDNIVQ